MSFDQHRSDQPQEDPRRGQDADATGSIYSGDEHTSPIPRSPEQPYDAGSRPADPFAPPQQQPGTASSAQHYGQPYDPASQQQSYAQGGYGQGQAFGAGAHSQQPAPAYGQGGYGGVSTTTAPRKRGRSWAAIPIAAILAAALASGGTYALTHDDNGSSAATGGNTTVVNANPADFADAGSVNWSATASKVTPSVVSITVQSGNSGDQGSGVILDKSGNIVTNNHVVTGSGAKPTVLVTLSDNKTYQAKVVGTDPSTDLAVIKLEDPPSNLTPISMSSKKLVVGQPAMAVGNPLGLAGTVTTGIVSALNRPVTTQAVSPNDGGNNGDPFGGNNGGGSGGQSSQATTVTTNAIQTSAAINPGNSGGALVNGSGELIGINSSIATLGQSSASSQSGNIGIGFAIPVPVVQNITSQLIKSGKATHAQLGVQVSTQTSTVKVGDAIVQAAKVVKVNDGSAAAKAGIKVNDMVVQFNGNQVVGSDSLVGFVGAEKPGTKVTLTIVRDGKQQNVPVTLGEASSS
ncbi:S1C family serine protease [Flexivirga meconopsidis]|uniref:S1C family serine protease n=1 Tax=Flexivirga meconopsidis TaxID=2977121 RepID=UPI00223ED06F|nr:trypsin-like peptidase domain-containing protein [Flexivirga meconopsidis]